MAMNLTFLHEQQPLTTNDHLRREFCWTEVRSGLGRILAGFAILIAGFAIAGAMLAAAVVQVIRASTGHVLGGDSHLPIDIFWLFYGGLGLISVACLFGYGSILIGYWRCLINVPERHGARWLLFTSMSCVFMGPAINIAASLAGDKGIQLAKGPQGLTRVELTPFAKKLQIAGALVGLVSLICFMLFLHAIARCFDDDFRAAHVRTYLLFLGILVAGSIYLYLARLTPADALAVLAGLGVGVVVAFMWYLYLIGSLRRCITDGLSRVKKPCDFAPPVSAPGHVSHY